MTSKLGWICLGRMGDAMAKRLLEGWHEVRAWNRPPAKAAPLVEYGATAISQLHKTGGS